MLQVRKSHFCAISAIFFQCYVMSQTQELMTVSDFGGGGGGGGVSRNSFLEEASFVDGGVCFSVGGRWASEGGAPHGRD